MTANGKIMHYPQPQQNRLDDWYQKPIGKYLLKLEAEALNSFATKIKGNYLMQIGGVNHLDYTKLFKIQKQVYVPVNSENTASDKLLNLAQMTPFYISPGTIDVIVIHHLLEAHKKSRKFLETIEKLLAPDGKLLIYGFNPYSINGITNFFHASNYMTPFCCKNLSSACLKSWLIKLGFNSFRRQTFGFNNFLVDSDPPEFTFLEPIAKRLCPSLGSIYLLCAEKKSIPLTLQKVHYQILKNFIPREPHAISQINQITTVHAKND